MDGIYGERAILEAIGWLIPSALGLLAVAFRRPREWLLGLPARLRAARAARAEDLALRRTMAREWPAFSGDLTRKVGDLQDTSSRVTSKMNAIRDDLLEQISVVRMVVGSLLAMTLADFDTSPDPRFLCDAQGRITHVNAKLAELLALDRDEMMEWRWRGRVPADLLMPFLERFAAANAGHYQLDDELQFRHRDRHLVRFRILLMPFPPDEGPATHWVAKLTPMDGPA